MELKLPQQCSQCRTNVLWGLTERINHLARNPTYVILDSGCTRAMGSRYAVNRLIKAVGRYAPVLFHLQTPSFLLLTATLL